MLASTLYGSSRSAIGPFAFALMLCASLTLSVAPVRAQESGTAQEQPETEELLGIAGPVQSALGKVARIDVPEGYRFFDPGETRTVLESMGNPSSQHELGLVACLASDWFVVFEYSDDGHVKDDDSDKLDADDLLKSLREGNDAANETRKQRGWAEVALVGWAKPPRYDPATHNLEWATYAESEGHRSVNFNTRLLGRTGVMEVTLVCGAESLDAVLPDFKTLLASYNYVSGQRYSEFRTGDKIAEYGLTALVAGGAGVLAAKSGLFAKLWKLIAVAGVAVAAFFKRLFGKKSQSSDASA